MATFTDPNAVHNPSAGAVAPAAWGDAVRDFLMALYNAPSCRVFNNANIAVPNAAPTALTFNSERFDNDTIHDTSSNTARLTCRTAGVYVITGTVQWVANATGYRALSIRLNGVLTSICSNLVVPLNGVVTETEVTTIYKLAVGDYVQLVADQTSGGPLTVNATGNFSPEFGMAWLSAG